MQYDENKRCILQIEKSTNCISDGAKNSKDRNNQ